MQYAYCIALNISYVSVGVAIDYGLDGPGSNPGGEEIFRPSWRALEPTQPPVQWVPGLSRRQRWLGREAEPHPHLMPMS